MDKDVCRGTSGLQPHLCDVTRPRAGPGAGGARMERRSPARSHPERPSVITPSSFGRFATERGRDGHVKASLRIGVEAAL